jgi:pyruvyltransferase
MESLNLTWWRTKKYYNWGDVLNPILFEWLSGLSPVYISTGDSSDTHRYICIGSILPPCSPNSEIWGSGFMSPPWESTPIIAPKRIHAVRGPLTRDIFLKRGISCPKVYGDPALLCPMFYFPEVRKVYKLGIIPHYVDQGNHWIKWKEKEKNVLVIDILSGVEKVIDEILSCEMIISSSLHGIIAADAYGVPSLWVEFSDKVGGEGFKFRDYFMSVGRKDRVPIKIDGHSMLRKLYPKFYEYHLDIDLKLLLDSCPFYKENLK